MISLILNFYNRMRVSVEKGVSLQRALEVPVKQEIARAKIHPSETFDSYAQEIESNMEQQFQDLSKEVVEVTK